MFKITEEWRKAFPGAYAGILDMRDVVNPDHHPGLDARKRKLEDDLRVRFKEPSELKLLGPIAAYKAFYKRFKKSYHVQHQLESVIFKGKSIPKVAALVEAMFIAELRNMLLTAGHDRDSIRNEITLDISKGTERYVKINGEEQELKAGDMMMADAEGVISSVIYGPDRRTMITSKTRSALFTVYAVQGIGEQEVRRHLEEIADNVKLISPDCRVEALEVYAAG